MQHVLAAASGVPVRHIGSTLLAFIEKFAKIIGVVIIAGLILWQGAPVIWTLLCGIVLGIFIVPSFSPSISQGVAKINHGSAVGTTGASAGELALLAILVGITAFLAFRSN